MLHDTQVHIKQVHITPEDVLADSLGLANEEAATRIAEARLRNDAELVRLEARLGLEASESEVMEVPDSIVRLLSANPYDAEMKKADFFWTEFFARISQLPEPSRLFLESRYLNERSNRGTAGSQPIGPDVLTTLKSELTKSTITETRCDLEVALFHFGNESADNPISALEHLQFLLLDEDTFLARLAFLQVLAGSSAEGWGTVEPFEEQMALICRQGLFAAHSAGRLTPDMISQLDQLSRTPAALYECRRRLVTQIEPGHEKGVTVDPKAAEETGITKAIHQA